MVLGQFWERLVSESALSGYLSQRPVQLQRGMQAEQRHELPARRNYRLHRRPNILLGFDWPPVLLQRHNLSLDRW